MRLNYLPSGMAVVVPDTDLEERVVRELMAALAPNEEHRDRIRAKVIHRDGEGVWESFSPDWFYYLEALNDGRFALVASED